MSTENNSTTSANSRQLSIFTPHFDERIRRIEIDGVAYFSVLDIFEHYGSAGSASNPRQYWSNVKKRLAKQSAAVVPQVVYPFAVLIQKAIQEQLKEN